MTNIKRDMLIGIDWIQKIETSMKKKRIEFNIMESEIFE